MAEEKTEANKKVARIDLSSRFWKTFLVIVSAVLTFAGPTYFVYAMVNVIGVDYAISMISGFVLFAIGLVLIRYLIKKNIFS